mmetsp:Transcript_16619/g.54129  ORF Transcript_16619/g.54129 Transcript_16619/m.54129 type:complete len:319 (+) Transcript_16619:776-1732(+)
MGEGSDVVVEEAVWAEDEVGDLGIEAPRPFRVWESPERPSAAESPRGGGEGIGGRRRVPRRQRRRQGEGRRARWGLRQRRYGRRRRRPVGEVVVEALPEGEHRGLVVAEARVRQAVAHVPEPRQDDVGVPLRVEVRHAELVHVGGPLRRRVLLQPAPQRRVPVREARVDGEGEGPVAAGLEFQVAVVVWDVVGRGRARGCRRRRLVEERRRRRRPEWRRDGGGAPRGVAGGELVVDRAATALSPADEAPTAGATTSTSTNRRSYSSSVGGGALELEAQGFVGFVEVFEVAFEDELLQGFVDVLVAEEEVGAEEVVLGW